MRCKECGWPNKPSATHCSKCNAPLEAENYDVDMTVNYNGGNSSRQPQTPSQAPRRTVYENDIFGPSPQAPHQPTRIIDDTDEDTRPMPMPGGSPQPAPTSGNKCPKCGYPLRPGSSKCPNCNYAIMSTPPPIPEAAGGSRAETPDEGERRQPSAKRQPTRIDSAPPGGKNPFGGTVNPYMMGNEPDPAFSLKPVKRHKDPQEFEERKFEGTEIKLSRDNTDPNNPSITSRQQAVITNEGGVWYIQDTSDLKTTFVRAGEKIELHDGDIILLGNRLFEFRKK